MRNCCVSNGLKVYWHIPYPNIKIVQNGILGKWLKSYLFPQLRPSAGRTETRHLRCWYHLHPALWPSKERSRAYAAPGRGPEKGLAFRHVLYSLCRKITLYQLLCLWSTIFRHSQFIRESGMDLRVEKHVLFTPFRTSYSGKNSYQFLKKIWLKKRYENCWAKKLR